MSASRRRAFVAWFAAVLLPEVAGAERPGPASDLLIELREIDAQGGEASGWDVRSTDAAAAREQRVQQLRVRNGAQAKLRVSVSRPLQVWPARPGAWLAVPLPALEWISAGQQLDVQPHWPGGSAPVSVVVRSSVARLDPHVAAGSADPPERLGVLHGTTISAPLGTWVTLAAGGAADATTKVVASGDAVARRVLQMRVSLAR